MLFAPLFQFFHAAVKGYSRQAVERSHFTRCIGLDEHLGENVAGNVMTVCTVRVMTGYIPSRNARSIMSPLKFVSIYDQHQSSASQSELSKWKSQLACRASSWNLPWKIPSMPLGAIKVKQMWAFQIFRPVLTAGRPSKAWRCCGRCILWVPRVFGLCGWRATICGTVFCTKLSCCLLGLLNNNP